MAFFTPVTSLEARSASDRTTAEATEAAAQRGVMKLLNPNIVVVGCINEDTTIDVQTIPAPGETVLGKDVRTSFGGKGANQAVQAALLIARNNTTQDEREQLLVGEGEKRDDDNKTGTVEAVATAAVEKIKEKVAVVTEKIGAAATTKTPGDSKGVVKSDGGEGWLSSQLSSSTTRTQREKEEEAAEGGKDVLLKKGIHGEKVALICKLGDDEAGTRYRQYLDDLNVHSEGIFTAVKGEHTGRAFITVSIQENGENAISYVPGANEHLTPSDIQQPHIVRLLQQSKVVVCENGVAGSVTVEALRLAKSAADDIITIFTPSPVAHVPREAFAYVDYVVLNAIEAQQLYDQLILPLSCVRDTTAGQKIYEEQQEEGKVKAKEKEWPSLYAMTASEKYKKQSIDKRYTTTAAAAAAGKTTITLPPPLALRERLRAVGTHAVEITSTTINTPWKGRGRGVGGGGEGGGGGHVSAAAAPAAVIAAEGGVARTSSALSDKDIETSIRHEMKRNSSTEEDKSEVEIAAGGKIATADDIEVVREKQKEQQQQQKQQQIIEKECERSERICDVEKRPRRGKCDVIITAGNTGCTITDGTQVLHVSPRRVVQPHDVVDTVGAGDAFVGALAYFLSHNKTNIEEAVAKAGVVASYSVQKKGASISYADRNTLGEDFFNQ